MKKEKSAIGLLYENEQDSSQAPVVSLKGFGELAEQIEQLAEEHGILVHEDAVLADTLKQLELGQEIPRELYIIIAELIAFSYVLQGKFPPGWQALMDKLDVKV